MTGGNTTHARPRQVDVRVEAAPVRVTGPRDTAPRVVLWAALVVCVAGIATIFVGGWRTGVWTDEPAHVLRFSNLQDHGWYLLDDDFDGGQPGEWVTDQYVYAPVTMQMMHGVNRAVGLDPPGAAGISVRAYSVRHLVVGLMGLLGVLAVGALGRLLLGSWSWGAVSAGVLMAIPMWPGLSEFDLKDIPAGTGYTLVTLALVGLVVIGEPKVSSWWAAWPFLVMTLGLTVALGTRPGLWPGLAAALGMAMLAVVLVPASASPPVRRRQQLRVLVSVAASCVVAYGLLLLSYPTYFSQPNRWLMQAVGQSAQYSGTFLSTDHGSSAYVPSRVLALVMPPGLLLVSVVGLSVSARLLRRPSATLAGWMLVGSQAVLLPVLAMLQRSSLGDDLRQLAFAVPAVALLITVGWKQLVVTLGGSVRWAREVLTGAWVLAVLVPTAVQLQLFPYAYSYSAPQASSLGAIVQDDWARLSLRELLPDIPRDEYVTCTPKTSDRGDTMRYGIDCATDPAGSLTPFGLSRREGDLAIKDTFIAVFTRGIEPGRNCRELGRVERKRYLATAVMSRVARCRLVLPAYPEGGVTLRPGVSEDFLLEGWVARSRVSAMELSGHVGSLGFQLPEKWTRAPLRVELEGSADGMPAAYVNNQRLPVASTSNGWSVDVPAATAAAMGAGRMVIALVGPTAATQLRLYRVRLQGR